MAVLTSAEVNEQADLVYIRGTYFVALTLQTVTDYDSGVTLSTIENDEVTAGNGGYARLSYAYTAADLLTYANGQPLSGKVATFVHDGSSTDITFNHVVLLRDVSGTVSVVGFQKLSEIITLTNSTSVEINVGILHGVA